MLRSASIIIVYCLTRTFSGTSKRPKVNEPRIDTDATDEREFNS
jgi:hypothetical protein